MAYLVAADIRVALPKLDDVARFPDSLFDELIESFAEIAEDYRGIAFAPRVSVESFVPCTTAVVLTEPSVTEVASVSIDDVAQAATTWRLMPGGTVLLAELPPIAAGGFPPVVTVTYTHGLATVPRRILDACLEYVRASASARVSGLPRDVVFTSKDGTATRYSTPDWDRGRPTGWTEVDRLLNSVPDYRVPAIV